MTPDELADTVLARLPPGRRIVAIAGAPGSGKSTLAEVLVDTLNTRAPGQAALLPMDGFHYDDLFLVPAGLRDRKGAPDTFDAAGFGHALRRLRAADEPHVAVPVFDRKLEIARAGARLIPATARIIVTEGNWLLLDRAPWSDLAPLYDLTVALDVPEGELERRLIDRWLGFGFDPERARDWVASNDMPNARLATRGSRPADITIRQPG
ncbi:MAG: nucleoside triphosphate hydrolase [Rhodobacteraceae bacterium]|jgi:pantothenate kinase|nr:nucleoside triphosphate hydrolase [Paracoccaceae bacterium]